MIHPGLKPLDWVKEQDDIFCANCAYARIIAQTAVGHRLGCTHTDVTRNGLPVPIVKARSHSELRAAPHICGPFGKYWTKKK